MLHFLQHTVEADLVHQGCCEESADVMRELFHSRPRECWRSKHGQIGILQWRIEASHLGCPALQENSGKQLWHTPRVPIAGLPEKEHWPKAQQLVSLLRCQPGRPVATQVG